MSEPLLFKVGDRVEVITGIVGGQWDWQPGKIVEISAEKNPFGEDYPYVVEYANGRLMRTAGGVRPAPVSGGSPDAGPSLANDLLAATVWSGRPVPPEADAQIVAITTPADAHRDVDGLTIDEIDEAARYNAAADLDDEEDSAAEQIAAYVKARPELLCKNPKCQTCMAWRGM